MADQDLPTNVHDPEHAEHDPELIAVLLDQKAPDAERANAQARTETCSDCRALLADLVSLAAATVALPTPTRPREFTLTPDVAARLRRDVAGELTPAADRLSREMIHSTSGHAAHDRILIASLVDRSIGDAERALAERQVDDCRACAQLHEELVALAMATRALPAPARTRDFTLSPDDAARLHGSAWRRLIAAIGSSRDVFSRPLAIGFTTLGLAGLLVATVPMPFGGATGGAAQRLAPVGAPVGDNAAGSEANPEFMTQASGAPLDPAASGPAIAAAGPSAAPSEATEAAPAAPPENPDVLFDGAESSQLPGELDASRQLYFDDLGSDGAFVASPMLIVAALLLLVGLGLFGLRWTARRLGDG